MLMKLVRCAYDGFSKELKTGNYYWATPCPVDNGFYFINGLQDASGCPVQFASMLFTPFF